MPLPNLHGRWMQRNFEINISGPTNDGEIKVKAVSAELMTYWQSGYGRVHESYKLSITFVKQLPNGQIIEDTIGGYVTADGQEFISRMGWYGSDGEAKTITSQQHTAPTVPAVRPSPVSWDCITKGRSRRKQDKWRFFN
jgi:hypothetical protein